MLETDGFDHAQVLCPPGGEDAARAFWCDIVGLVEVDKPAPLRERGGAWFRCGAHGIHVGSEPGFAPAKRAHVAIRVSSIAAYDALAERLEAAGHAVEHAAVPIATRRMKTHDAHGNLVEFLVGTTG